MSGYPEAEIRHLQEPGRRAGGRAPATADRATGLAGHGTIPADRGRNHADPTARTEAEAARSRPA